MCTTSPADESALMLRSKAGWRVDHDALFDPRTIAEIRRAHKGAA